MPTLVLDEPHGSVLHGAGRAAMREQIAFARRAARALGHLRIGLRRAATTRWPTSTRRRACRASRCAARRPTSWWSRPTPPRSPRRSRRTAPSPTCAARSAAARAAATASSRRSTSRRRARPSGQALPAGRDLHGAPPGHEHRRARQRAARRRAAPLGHGATPRSRRWPRCCTSARRARSRQLPIRAAARARPTRRGARRGHAARGRSRHGGARSRRTCCRTAATPSRCAPTAPARAAGGASGVTRSRDDALRDAYGSFFYLRWDRQPRAGLAHPASGARPGAGALPRAASTPTACCFDADWPELRGAHARCWVSPEDDIEFRQRRAAQHRRRARSTLELISSFEVDARRPARRRGAPGVPEPVRRAPSGSRPAGAAAVERKPRLHATRACAAAHFVAAADAARAVGRRADRPARWLGRNRDARHAAALDSTQPPARRRRRRVDTGLDPVAALRGAAAIAPGAHGARDLRTAAARQRDDAARGDRQVPPAEARRARLADVGHAGAASACATCASTRRELRALQTLTTVADADTTPRAHARPRRRAATGACSGASASRATGRSCWCHPPASPQGLGLLRSLRRRCACGLAAASPATWSCVNAEPASYLMPLQREIDGAARAHVGAADAAQPRATPRPASTCCATSDLSRRRDWRRCARLARVRFNADGRPLAHHVQELRERARRSALERAPGRVAARSLPAPTRPRPADARRAAGRLRRRRAASSASRSTRPPRPPRPWVNVLANPGFGAQISRGRRRLHLGRATAGCTSSRRGRTTRSPTRRASGSCCRTCDTRELVRSRRRPAATRRRLPRRARPGLHACSSTGAATWRSRPPGASIRDERVKQVRVRARQPRAPARARLRALGDGRVAAWARRAATARTVAQRCEAPTTTLPRGCSAHAARTAPPASAAAPPSSPSPARPTAPTRLDLRPARVLRRARPRSSCPTSCGQRARRRPRPLRRARRRELTLRAGESARAASSCSATPPSAEAARQLARRWQPRDVPRGAGAGARAAGTSCSARRTVRTPDPLFDAMVNRWLLYQTVACRLWAQGRLLPGRRRLRLSRPAAGRDGPRAGPHPTLLREQILLNASRQFPEGDVQHWWHAPSGAGVRTHFSDDLLWLPYACAHYVEATGDAALLDERVPFIEGAGDPRRRRGRLLRAAASAPRRATRLRALRARDRPQPARSARTACR